MAAKVCVNSARNLPRKRLGQHCVHIPIPSIKIRRIARAAIAEDCPLFARQLLLIRQFETNSADTFGGLLRIGPFTRPLPSLNYFNNRVTSIAI
jgi:hypothetical protein